MQDAITYHLLKETPTEEKAIKTLHNLLTPPKHHKETIVNSSPLHGTIKQTVNNNNKPITPLIEPQVSTEQHIAPKSHIITQDDTDTGEEPLVQHQYNLGSQAQLIANNIEHPSVHKQCFYLAHRQLNKQTKYKDIWVTSFANELGQVAH